MGPADRRQRAQRLGGCRRLWIADETILPSRRSHFSAPRRRPETDSRYQRGGITKGTYHDFISAKDISPSRIDGRFSDRPVRRIDFELCLQPRGAADVHRRRFPALQFCHPERFGRYRVHAQAAGQLKRWLQDRDGQGSSAAI
jgi:hypothetical protein